MGALKELHERLIELYGYEIEVSLALHVWHENLLSWTSRPGLREQLRRNSTITFGRGNPNTPDARWQYETTHESLVEASRKNGINAQTLRRAVITIAYSYWEDRYRSMIADECGFAHKNDIQSEVFTDLNKYRQSILHAGGVLQREPSVIRLFSRGDMISLEKDHMHDLFTMMVNGLNQLGETYYGQNLQFAFDKPLR